MYKYLLILSLFLCGCSAVTTQEPETTENSKVEEVKQVVIEPYWDDELAEKIENLRMDHHIDPNNMAIVIQNFSTGQSYWANENEIFTAASIYKLPLAMLYYDEIYQGNKSLEDELTFLPEYFEDAGQISAEYSTYSDIPLSVLLQYSIRYSDNNAGHILFENLGGWTAYTQLREKYFQENWRELEQELEEEKDNPYPDPEIIWNETELVLENEDGQEISEESIETDTFPDEEQIFYDEEFSEDGEYYEFYEEENLDNIITARLVADCLYYIYEHPDIMSVLIEDMKLAEPGTYLNGYTPEYYAQKYGSFGSALNIAGLSFNDPDYMVVVLSEFEPEAEDFINDLGNLLKDYFSVKGLNKGANSDKKAEKPSESDQNSIEVFDYNEEITSLEK